MKFLKRNVAINLVATNFLHHIRAKCSFGLATLNLSWLQLQPETTNRQHTCQSTNATTTNQTTHAWTHLHTHTQIIVSMVACVWHIWENSLQLSRGNTRSPLRCQQQSQLNVANGAVLCGVVSSSCCCKCSCCHRLCGMRHVALVSRYWACQMKRIGQTTATKKGNAR